MKKNLSLLAYAFMMVSTFANCGNAEVKTLEAKSQEETCVDATKLKLQALLEKYNNKKETTIAKTAKGLSLNWEYKPVAYKHFTDLGNYFIQMNDADVSDFGKVNASLNKIGDPFRLCCTASAKRNKKGEVIIGRNMDIEISQNPAYITRIKGGKYDTVSFTYLGNTGKYSYQQLKEQDEDLDFLRKIPFLATDAMNETGLYVEANMRDEDDDYDMYCRGLNPGKERASLLSAAAMIALNCSTVAEAIDYMKNSYDWYSVGIAAFGDGTRPAIWNLAFIIGDATGEYGLMEFGTKGVYYTPYANGQGNYYVHPELAEYALHGCGYGRLSAAIKNLPKCETDWDMLHNMEDAMWKNEILNPGILGYSDFEDNLLKRRQMSKEEMQTGFEKKMEPLLSAATEYYNGNEKPLRDNASVWTTSFNFAVNCSTKHLILRLWEKDSVTIQYQW